MTLELKLSDQKSWQVSPYLAKYLGVQEGEEIWLQTGANRCQATVQIHEYYPVMTLYKKWANELRLTPGQWKVRRAPDGIRFGPIIGIVCQNPPTLSPADSTWIRYFSALDGGQLILIPPEGFDSIRRCVYGFTLSPNKTEWIPLEAPWPDVLYVRTYPIEPTFQTFLETEYKNRYFNTTTRFNKWTVYQHLSPIEALKPYLPDTALLDNIPKQLRNWVNQYSTVYLKPLYGNKGKGIVKISCADPDRNSYRVQYRDGEHNVDQRLHPAFPIQYILFLLMGTHPYLIQQGIPVPRKKDKIRDFRVLLQKKDDGHWHMTGLGGRQSAEGSIVTNLYNGGERIHLATLLQDDPLTRKERIQEIKALCLNAAFILEQQVGLLGELGFDLCIDQENRLWLLEVNAQPSKFLFTEFYSPAVAQNVHTAPLLYASYLCGFSETINPLL